MLGGTATSGSSLTLKGLSGGEANLHHLFSYEFEKKSYSKDIVKTKSDV